MTVELFKKLLLLRDDVYSKQTSNGAYIPVEEKITDEVIKQHLEGDHTIGLYQLKKDKIKWACLDIDLEKSIWSKENFDLSEWEELLKKQAEKAKEILKANGIPSYIENSGHKGYHVWIFFKNPVLAAPVKKGMERYFNRYMKKMHEKIEWEVFPKQSKVFGEGLGNLVKGPSGFHNKSGEFSRWVDQIDPNDVQYADPFYFHDIGPIEAIRFKCGAIREHWEKAIKDGHASHDTRVAIGTLFSSVKKEDQELAEEYVIKEFFSKMKDFNEQKTRYYLKQMRERPGEDPDNPGYAPVSCKSLQGDKYDICPAKCQEIQNGTTPHDFYKWKKGIAPEGQATFSSPPPSSASGGGSGNDSLSKYTVVDNCYYYKKADDYTEKVSSFIINIEYRYVIDDEMDNYTIYKGYIKSSSETVDFEIPATDYADNNKLHALIHELLSPTGLLIPKSMHQLRQAVSATSNTKKINVGKTIGFNSTEADPSNYPTEYYMPSYIVDKQGIHENDKVTIDLSGEKEASRLDFVDISDELFNELLEHIDEDLLQLLNKGAAYSCFAHTFVPLIFPFISANGDKTRYSLFIRGTTGVGKSFFTMFMQNFYGYFHEGDVAHWMSTANALSRIGYYFKDTIFNIDDYKKDNLGSNYAASQKNSLIQSFSDGSTRDRMKQDLTLNKSFPIRGWITCAAEHLPEGEASVLARIISVEAKIDKKQVAKGNRCKRYKQYYPGFTARYLHTLFNTHPALIEGTFDKYVEMFHKPISEHSNGFRIARFTAILTTSFHFVSKFLWPKKKAQEQLNYFISYQQKRIKQSIYESTEELATEKFVQILNELISTGKAGLQESSSSQVVKAGFERAEIIGYYANVKTDEVDKEIPHIVTSQAWELVQKSLNNSGTKINHSLRSVIQDLYQQGFIMDEREAIRKMNNNSVRVIRFYPDKFNPEELKIFK